VKKKEKSNPPTIHSSAAEYLTFVAAMGFTPENAETRYQDENIWLTQKMMAALYDVSVAAVNQHIKRIYADGELEPGATIKKYLIVQTEGARRVEREIDHYNLQMIIAVGFRVNNDRAARLRKWAGQIVKDYAILGWTMDVDRLKNGHMFTDEYFERQLQKIHEIRLSERKFYQKVTDLYATAFDYDKDAKTTKDFFKLTLKKLHFAVYRHAATELIVERVNSDKERKRLTTWETAPLGKIFKTDASIEKNYLSEREMNYLERIVSIYLDFAETRAKRKIPMSMEDWAKRLDGFLEFNGDEILTGPEKISHEQAKLHAETEYEKYRITQDGLFRTDFNTLLKANDERVDKT
jgi:hypothetical protein